MQLERILVGFLGHTEDRLPVRRHRVEVVEGFGNLGGAGFALRVSLRINSVAERFQRLVVSQSLL